MGLGRLLEKRGGERVIVCQNCLQELALKDDELVTLRYVPSEVETMLMPLTDDKVLYSIQCPSCSCIVQVII